MLISTHNGFYYLTSGLFNKFGIKHCFATIKDTEREAVVSFSNRNSYSDENVYKSFEKIAELFDTPMGNIVKSHQIHEDNVLTVSDKHLGMGVIKESDITNADGLITDKNGVPLCIFSADCVPILLADKNKRVVAAVHSGWRGTAKAISVNAINIMKKEYGVLESDIICAIGPAIGKCCFEVSEDVIEALSHIKNAEKYHYKKDNGKYMLDLKGVNRQILINAGIKEENIDLCDMCTKCEKELFFSYRRQGEEAGRNAAFVMKD